VRNIIQRIRNLAKLGYSTQPGVGHPNPSGQISIRESPNKINEEDADKLWWNTFELEVGPPIGTNKPNKEYRGPHNNREWRRAPHVTIKNYIQKSKLRGI